MEKAAVHDAVAADVLKHFRESDENSDGLIEDDVFMSLVTELMPAVHAKRLSALLEEADVIKDGMVDYTRFIELVFGVGHSTVDGDAAGPAVVARPPTEIPTLERMEVEKGMVRQGLKPEYCYRIRGKTVLYLSMGIITNFEGDAIVNPADPGCLGGRGGLDRAISAAGGQKLRDARIKLPIVAGGGAKSIRCPHGEARITIGGSLKARFCIHAVGPHYNRTTPFEEDDALLVSSFQAALACGQSKKLNTIAFVPISAGHFRGPQTMQRVLECAIEGIVSGVYDELAEVHFVLSSSVERGSRENPMLLTKAICDRIS